MGAVRCSVDQWSGASCATPLAPACQRCTSHHPAPATASQTSRKLLCFAACAPASLWLDHVCQSRLPLPSRCAPHRGLQGRRPDLLGVRVGGAENTLLGSSDLSTMIGPGTGKASFDASGTAIYNNRRTVTSSDRTLINAFKTISEMADRINLPKTIIDRANNLFKMVHDGKNLKGRANDAIAAACLYIACRQEGVPRTFKEIV